MNAIKRHPYFSAWVLCCVVLVAGGFGWLHRLRKSAHRELASVAQKSQQRDHLLQQARSAEPVLAEPVVISRDVAIAPITPKPTPQKPLEGFIAIAGAREEWRRLAASQQVALLPEELFGFATHAHEGPRENQLAAVHAQLGLTQQVLEKLFAARPDKLLAVRREHVRVNEREGVPEVAADFFELEARLDLRVAGVIEGQAMQVEFIGQTQALQSFLNALATAAEPLLVRSVEGEPMPENQNSPGKSTKFSVIVELAEPAVSAGTISGSDLRPATLRLWTTPTAALAGENRGYDLFSEPGENRVIPREAPMLVATEGFALLQVQREPYRLQLVGYYGAPGDYTATFVSAGTFDTLLARAGHRFASLGLTLKFFGVEPRGTKTQAGEFSHELIARAQLWDESKMAMVTLVSDERLLTDTLRATLRFDGGPARSREFRVGESFQEGEATCRIERIQLDPAEVVIVRVRPGTTPPERLVLKPTDHAPLNVSSSFPSK